MDFFPTAHGPYVKASLTFPRACHGRDTTIIVTYGDKYFCGARRTKIGPSASELEALGVLRGDL